MSVKLILFDFENTLVRVRIDYESIREKVKSFFVEKGLPKNFNFKPILKKIDEAIVVLKKRGLGEDEGLKKAALKIITQEECLASQKATLITGTKSTLKYLRSKNIMIGIFSRTSEKAIKMTLDKFDLEPFNVLVGRETVLNPKPNPEGILFAIDRLHLKPSKIIVVGDHPYDIKAGKKVGAFTIGVLTGLANKKELTTAGADFVLENISDFSRFYEEKFIFNHRNSRL